MVEFFGGKKNNNMKGLTSFCIAVIMFIFSNMIFTSNEFKYYFEKKNYCGEILNITGNNRFYVDFDEIGKKGINVSEKSFNKHKRGDRICFKLSRTELTKEGQGIFLLGLICFIIGTVALIGGICVILGVEF